MTDTKKKILEWSNLMLLSSDQVEANEIKPLRQEASTREYFRLKNKNISYIGVFAPPETELNEQFVFLSKFFRKEGVTVPEVIFSNTEEGLMLVQDFGDKSYQFILNKENYHHLFSSAIDEMLNIQKCPYHPQIPILNEIQIEKQMRLFEEWFLKGLLNLKITKEEKLLIEDLYKEILKDLAQQPQVLCHFDFESRNLMVLEEGNTGVLDFQDATFGPIFLDPVSLFKDLYFDISEQEINDLIKEYVLKASELGLIERLSLKHVKRSFDLSGLQRQLRILGTLSRLHLDDGKSFRLRDLIKTLHFVIESCSRYSELKDVSEFFLKRISPLLHITLKEIS